MLKKAISILLIITLISSSGILVLALEESNAQILFELKLLKGTDKGFELEKSLTRAEAATFIVNLLGKQFRVAENPQVYTVDVFSDVTNSAWYAATVGYCYTNGIITGYPDSTFRPNNEVSEKEFLHMVLKAMGSSEHGWNNVFNTSYEFGLVTDRAYSTQIQDSNSFVRGNVVDILYNSLNLAIVGEDRTVIQRLIDEAIVTEAQVNALGVVKKDETLSAISEITVVDSGKVTISFNEEVYVDIDDIVIEVDSEVLEVNNLIINGKDISIECEKFNRIKYNITIHKVVDNEGNVVRNLSDSFSAFVPNVVESDYFHISNVEAINENLIHVTFTHPVSSNIAVPNMFEIRQNEDVVVESNFAEMSVKALAEDENKIGIWFKNLDMTDDDIYTLVVDGNTKSEYTTKLNDGKDEVFNFIGSSIKADDFEIDDIEVIEDDYIRIRFNKEVDITSASNKSNYELLNKSNGARQSAAFDVYMSGDGEWKNREVTVRFIFNDNVEYELIVNDIEDIYKADKIVDDVFTFNGYPDIEYAIDYAVARNENYVQIFLSHPASYTSVMNGVILIGGHAPEKVIFESSNPYTINAFMEAVDAVNNDSQITLTNIETVYGNPMGAMSYSIPGNSEDPPSISISEVKRVGDEEVYIRFGYPISTSMNNTSKFEFTYRNNDDDKVTLNSDTLQFINNYEVIVKCGELKNEDYRVVLSNIVDITGDFTTSEISKSFN